MEFEDINIDSIRIIAKKTEAEVFDFHNPNKAEDGFVLFTEGSIDFFYGDSPPVKLSTGDLVLLKKHDRYRFICKNGCTYVTAAYTFSRNSDITLNKLPKTVSCPKELQKKILDAESLWQSRTPNRAILCRIRLLEIFEQLLRHSPTASPKAAYRLTEKAKDFIHAHFKKSFTVSELAAYCNISPSRLREVFSSETGETITDFRDDLRINTAKEMLTSGFFTIKETALELGYCDVYFFSKKFKEKTGISPARYRDVSINSDTKK